MREINLEIGYPNVERAMFVLKNELVTERHKGTKQVKIIHGYGSTGTGGGSIKAACHRDLRGYIRTGTIRAFCPGEKFGPFAEEGRNIVTRYPQLKGDRDWARGNDGITIVVF